MHCAPGDEHALMAAFRTFLSSSIAMFPTGLQWTFPPAGVKIDELTGDVTGAWTDGSPVSALSATAAGTWANGVGIRVKWTTGVVHGGHHVSGSTFLVPILTGNYEGAGNILDVAINGVQTAATTMVGAGVLQVWSRPSGGTPGFGFPVTGAVVPDRVSWLRGRRT